MNLDALKTLYKSVDKHYFHTFNANSIFRLSFIMLQSKFRHFYLHFFMKSLNCLDHRTGQSKNIELKYYGSVLILSVSPVRVLSSPTN